MALIDTSKASSAFKLLQGKAHTSNLNELANEAISSGITMSAQRIFAENIHPTPNNSSNVGIVSAEIVLVLEAVSGSDTNQVGTPRAYRTKLGGSVPASLVGKINPVTNAVYAINDYVGSIIPQSFGVDFRPRLYSDAAATVEIPPSSAADWFIDCFAGVVTQEGQSEGASGFTLGANGRVRAYVYVGDFVSDAIGGVGTVNLISGSGTTVINTNIGGTAGYAVDLGGTLTQDTVIFGSDIHNLSLGTNVNRLNDFSVFTGNSIIMSAANDFSVNADNVMSLQSQTGSIILTAPAGAVFAADYSAGYSARSIVDKEYVDSVAAGLDPKASVRATTTSFITLSGAQTIDGVSVIPGNRVLVKDQGTAGVANGIYVVEVGTWTRSSDFDGTPASEVTAGSYFFVEEGTLYQDTGWVLATNNPITLNTTSLQFVQFSSAGVTNASNGLTKIGNNITLGGLLNVDVLIDGVNSFGVGFNDLAYFNVFSPNAVSLISDGQLELQALTGVLISGPTGAKYSADYAANYTNRSLVDKAYVDGTIGAAGTNGVATASNGLTKIGQNVVLGGTLTGDTEIIGSGQRVRIGYNSGSLSYTGIQNIELGSSQTMLLNSQTAVEIAGTNIVRLYSGDLSTTGFEVNFNASTGNAIITDNTSTKKGLQYAADYAANYTNRSLVDKAYVDGTIAAAGTNGVATASNGLTKIGQNVVLGGALTSNTTITGAYDFNIASATVNISDLTLTQTLNNSTAGYDLVVRNTATGHVEKISSTILTGSVPTIVDKNLIPTAGTSGNGIPTGLTITFTPSADSYVDVKVNGISVQLGTSSISGDAYFALPGSGGVVGRTITNITAADEFYWNATIAGYYLDNLDIVDFIYSV
jgi:hypothetical protein